MSRVPSRMVTSISIWKPRRVSPPPTLVWHRAASGHEELPSRIGRSNTPIRSSTRWFGWCIRALKNCPKPGPPNLEGRVLSLFKARLLDLPRYYRFQPDVAGKLFSSLCGCGGLTARRFRREKSHGRESPQGRSAHRGIRKTQASQEKFWSV